MRTILTNMCLIINKKKQILVQDRLKPDWPGLNLPGGHVKKDESAEASVIREIKEETGLDIKNPLCVGTMEWDDRENNLRHLAILYRASDYEGLLKGSSEGQVFWISRRNLSKYKLSNDFQLVLDKCLYGLSDK